MRLRGFEVDVERLSRDLGGGFVAFAPDLTGCIADGRNRDEALRHLEDAIGCWLEVAKQKGSVLPKGVPD